MKNKDYVHNEYPKACRYCEHGSLSFDGSAVLCPKKGIMAPEDCCRRFVYDPLKRKPMAAPKLDTDYDPSDFAL